MIELLIIVATTVTLAAAGGEDSKKDCLQSIYVADINRPQITAIVYNASMLGQIHFLCFTLSNQGNTARKGLTVRLDYLPYLCIEASNDNPMNKVQDDGWYQVSIPIKRKCLSVTSSQQIVEIVYEARQTTEVFGILVYSYLLREYLPALVCGILLIFLIERLCKHNIEGDHKRE